MINRQALIVVLAAATATTHAFVVPPSATSIHRPLYSSIENRIQDETSEQITDMYQQASELSAANEEEKKLIMDIPPFAAAVSQAYSGCRPGPLTSSLELIGKVTP